MGRGIPVLFRPIRRKYLPLLPAEGENPYRPVDPLSVHPFLPAGTVARRLLRCDESHDFAPPPGIHDAGPIIVACARQYPQFFPAAKENEQPPAVPGGNDLVIFRDRNRHGPPVSFQVPDVVILIPGQPFCREIPVPALRQEGQRISGRNQNDAGDRDLSRTRDRGRHAAPQRFAEQIQRFAELCDGGTGRLHGCGYE